MMLHITREELSALIGQAVCRAMEQYMADASAVSDKEYLSVDEVCSRYAMKRSTLYKLTGARIVPSIKAGKRLLLAKVDIEAYLHRCRRQSVEELTAAL